VPLNRKNERYLPLIGGGTINHQYITASKDRKRVGGFGLTGLFNILGTSVPSRSSVGIEEKKGLEWLRKVPPTIKQEITGVRKVKHAPLQL